MAVERFIGIEIGGTKLQLVVGNAGFIEAHKRYVIDPLAGARGIQENISCCFREWQDEYMNDVSAIGVGFGGPVNWANGTVQVSHQVQGWDHCNLKQWLMALTGKPVCVDNDANVAALAEGTHGWGKQYDKLFYMTLGSGIGGGMINDGNIYHGMVPGELEIGHLRLDKDGTTLESRCSGWAIDRKVEKEIIANPHGLLAQFSKSGTAKGAVLLKSALARQDVAASEIILELTDDLAYALSHLIHLLHPEIIVIGGGLSLLGEALRLPLMAAIPKYIMTSFLPSPPVQIAKLGENVVPVGAMELAKFALKQDACPL